MNMKKVFTGITQTTPMNEPMDKTLLSDAVISLVDLTTGVEIQLESDSAGKFINPAPGIPGHDYRLSIKLGEKEFYSDSKMLTPTEILETSFKWIKMPGDDMAALVIRFADNPRTPDYYWVRVYRNGEPYQWSVINDFAQVSGIMEETLTTTHRDSSKEEDEKALLVDGDVLKVTVTPVDREMFDYLGALNAGNNGFKMFSGDECLGFFLASPVASATITYHPDDIKYAD